MITRILHLPLILVMLLLSPALMADDDNPRGKVLQVSGDVEVVDKKGEVRKVTKADESLEEFDTIVTRKESRIVVRFDDGTMSVLNEESRLRVEKTSWYSYLGGKVYFTFKRVFGQERRVKTPSATLGVRGTTFIIGELEDAGESRGETVSLKEGLLTVESTGPAFEIRRKKEQDEFAAFKQQHEQARKEMLDEFEQYRQQTRKEFVEYRRKFTLKPDRTITLSGYRVDLAPMTDEARADFEAFESEAEDLIRQFRSQDSQ